MLRKSRMYRFTSLIVAALLSLALVTSAHAQAPTTSSKTSVATKKAPPRPDFPPYSIVLKDFTKVVSSTDVSRTLFTVYRRNKDQQV
ncbi:MAG TPA: hypothetical protein DCE43_16065, partial [Planctomycetaceae bacterium]|nr:hypothetical protein [Planctomycetaceae bacterium]